MGATGQLNRCVFRVRAEQLGELPDSVRTDVEDLLVDAHRELRVRVAEQVHRTAWCHAELGEDRGEGTAKAVRRQMLDRLGERLVRARPRGLDDVLADVLRRLAVALAGEKERTVGGQLGLSAVVQDDVVERRDERDDALTGLGLDARHMEAPARQIDDSTELRAVDEALALLLGL